MAMAIFIPASVVLYKEPNNDLPPWPSIYCADDVAPMWFVETRPPGHVHLILKLTGVVDTGQLRWASTTDLGIFDPFAANEATKQSTPGLAEAYEIADNALDLGLGIDHWRDALASNHSDDDITTADCEEVDEMRQDSDIDLAIELSLKDVRSMSSSMIVISDDEELHPMPQYQQSKPLKQSKEVGQDLIPTPATSLGRSARRIFMPRGLTAPAASVPSDDVIEEDFGESSQFVQMYVGPDVDPASDSSIDPHRRRYKLQLLKHHIWDRPYFRDVMSARNYFEPIGENTWELVHPRLADISPEDFRLVAEYLSDGSFGLRDPDTEEEVAETFAECISAWKTAELLSMDDLLEHIVEKIRSTRPWWDLFNVMLFACFTYENEDDVPLQAHSDMKDMLSDFVAEHYDIYVEDDCLRAEFITRIKQFPELRRDIHKKIAEQTEQRLKPTPGDNAIAQEQNEQQNTDLSR